MNTNNLLNMVNYGAIDTVVNSPTFGQVLSVRGMRSTQVEFAVPVLITDGFSPRHTQSQSTTHTDQSKQEKGRREEQKDLHSV